MKDIKIKQFAATGLRGFKQTISLDLDEKSIVLYGDNGTGKSSIADLIEWFLNGKVNHLSDDEVGRNGLEALRNTSLGEGDTGTLSLQFKNTELDCDKTLFIKRGSIATETSNCETVFNEYIDASRQERVLVRYKELSDFVVATPGQRLSQLSAIIGFAEVTETKKLLNKIYKKLDRDIKTGGFETIIQNSQRVLITDLGQNIVQLTQFIEAINTLIKQYGHEKLEVQDIEDINTVITSLETPVDEKKIGAISFLEQLINTLATVKPSLEIILADYKTWAGKYNALVADVTSLNNLKLTDLLESGEKILSINTEDISECPLCLSDGSGKEILDSVQKRLFALKGIKSQKQALESSKGEIVQRLEDEKLKLRGLLTNEYIKVDNLAAVKQSITNIGLDAKQISDELGKANFNTKILSEITFNATDEYEAILKAVNIVIIAIKETLPKNSNTELIVKLRECYNAYKEIDKQNKAKAAIEKQRDTFEILCEDFAKKQKDALDSFFNLFSKNINDYYIFMNPDESVENIKLIPIEDEEELKGLTIEYEFYNTAVSPPHKYLSESHLNCLGLAFFLASVEAFNKVNKFFILDDVISSFDSNHRKRFLDLLAEKFNSYQIILLTHEKHFFEYARTVAKAKGWKVDSFKYSKEKGSYLAEPQKSVYDRIIQKLNDGESEKLGHDIRVYLEHFLKEIANDIEVKVSFRFNDRNEERMAPEVLNEIKSKITRSKGDDGLAKIADGLLSRTLLSNFIGNKDSHDSDYEASMGDCKAFWNDVLEIESKFKCGHCGKFINVSYYADDTKEIKCKCGRLKYPWTK
jgi:hypothetical protein